MLSPGGVNFPVIETISGNIRCKTLTANQSTTNTTGTGDPTLLAFDVEAGKSYYVRLRATGNGLRGTFTCPPVSPPGDAPYFGANDGFTESFQVAACVTNLTTITYRTVGCNSNLWTTATVAATAPLFGRARLVVPTTDSTLTFCIGGTAGTLFAGSSLEIEEIDNTSDTAYMLAVRETTTSIAGRDSSMVLPVEANKSYFLKLYVSANNGNGMKLAIKAPTGTTIKAWLQYFNKSGGCTRQEITALETYTTLAMTSAGAMAEISGVLTVGSTPGDVTLQFGSTVDATLGHLYAGSAMFLDEVEMV